jgi:hypothetical protein
MRAPHWFKGDHVAWKIILAVIIVGTLLLLYSLSTQTPG